MNENRQALTGVTMDGILRAIVNDDCATVMTLLKADPSLATRAIRKAKLYKRKILHWLYVNDTALHLAAAGYRVEITRLLLAVGADPNASKNHRCSTPLHYAADGYINGPAWDETRQVQTIQCLLDQGAEIDAPDKNGATPLHRAVRTRCAGAVRCLLRAGADPALKNKPGSTPFHLAVQNSGHGGTGAPAALAAQRTIIEELISFGVSPELKSGRGMTVWACVKSAWIRELLKQRAP